MILTRSEVRRQRPSDPDLISPPVDRGGKVVCGHRQRIQRISLNAGSGRLSSIGATRTNCGMLVPGGARMASEPPRLAGRAVSVRREPDRLDLATMRPSRAAGGDTNCKNGRRLRMFGRRHELRLCAGAL
jgi:hypothetical protein